MLFKFIKVSAFHVFCCLLGMGVVAINFTFSQNRIDEIILYSIFSVIMIGAYIFFGYRFITGDYDDSCNIKNYLQIWFVSLVLILVSVIGGIKTISLINLPFQPIGALLSELLSEKSLCILLSIVPSTLLQLGYIIRCILKK